MGRVWLELIRYLDSTVSTRFALVVVVSTAPKENRSGVLVSHVHYRGLSTTRLSRNHEWGRSSLLRLFSEYSRLFVVMVVFPTS